MPYLSQNHGSITVHISESSQEQYWLDYQRAMARVLIHQHKGRVTYPILHFKGERRESPRGLRGKVFHTKEKLVLFFSFGEALNLSGVHLVLLAQWQW